MSLILFMEGCFDDTTFTFLTIVIPEVRDIFWVFTFLPLRSKHNIKILVCVRDFLWYFLSPVASLILHDNLQGKYYLHVACEGIVAQI